MKKILFVFAAGIVAMTVKNEANAQQSKNDIAVLEHPKEIIEMYKSITGETNNTLYKNDISINAVRDFKKLYKTVTDEKWYKTKDGFTALFTLDDVRNSIFYSKNGSWLGSLKSYNENKLDQDIRDIVKSKYYDYKITYVNEAETQQSDGMPTYVINLQGEHNIKIVRVNNGEMSLYQEYQKQ